MEKTELERLLSEIKAGSLEQYEIIIDHYQQPIFTYCYHMLGHRQDTEDAVQEVLFRGYEHLDQYTYSLSFSAWLYRIAYNHCANVLKRRKLSRVLPFCDKYDEKAMKEEQESTKKEYVVQPIPLSDKLRNAEIEYKSQKGSAFVEVSILGDKNKSGGTLAENLEKVMIGDNEAVYSTFAPENGDTVHSLEWVKNGTKVNYSLRAKISVSTKEELLKMAEQINDTK
ncbi:sigma-70 family RNA polymerase sigma factor [Brevibacillus sp. BC25]|uniref:sigma-70 family RNA polymerase sigma factor n=1 Tax=Brevibacillus sp. BC25 TaxID=1144308 RepID=UPI00027112AD|nr:sigma-70 family RNA polymerase sigma factor [Brevibacillus sp. BC25]EJL27700.1 RNA polymerase sigma factor, sigma-70 family [Brevibacillus sp. BC25]